MNATVLPVFDTRQPRAMWLALFALLASVTLWSVGAFLPRPTLAPTPAPALGALPLSVVPNLGQRADDVRLEARIPGGAIAFMDDGVIVTGQSDVPLRVRFAGAQADTNVHGVDQGVGHMSFYGADPARWRSDVPVFGGVVYDSLYDGVALRYDGTAERLKGTYTVAPGADPAQIQWRYEGASAVSIGENGALQIVTAAATLTEHAPVAWQVIDGRQVPVAARYALAADGTASFVLGSYNPALPLVIDPDLVFGTYLGGSSSDYGRGIALDGSRNIYVVGDTFSDDFLGGETTGMGSTDVVVLKLSPDGKTLLYGALIGGSSSDEGLAIAVDSTGAAFITVNASDDFPIFNALHPDRPTRNNGVLVKLDANGGGVFSTWLDFAFYPGQNVAVDAQGSVYVTGEEYTQNFNRVIALAKYSADGGSSPLDLRIGDNVSGRGVAVALGADGQIYLTGRTSSWGSIFPVTPNAFQKLCGRKLALGDGKDCDDDAFVAVLDQAGNMTYGTYLGGNGGDDGVGIAPDKDGNIIVHGNAFSTDFPTVAALQPSCPVEAATDACYYDTFVTKIKANGSELAWSTFLNSNERDSMEFAKGVVVDSAGNAYVTGFTEGTKFPIKDAVQDALALGNCSGGFTRFCFDAYVTSFAPDGTLRYSTYLGGTGDEYNQAIALDSAGSVYLIGYSESANFPTTAGTLQPKAGPGNEFYVAKISTAGGATAPPIDRPYRAFLPMTVR